MAARRFASTSPSTPRSLRSRREDPRLPEIRDESEQKTVLSIVRNLLDAESGDIDGVAVLAQAGGTEAVIAGGDAEGKVASLIDAGVAFIACANTLEARDVAESHPISRVETVQEGAVEATRLQEEGYAYLRP